MEMTHLGNGRRFPPGITGQNSGWFRSQALACSFRCPKQRTGCARIIRRYTSEPESYRKDVPNAEVHIVYKGRARRADPQRRPIRVKASHGARLMPHKHAEDRVYTVISGVFYIGLGDEFDPSKLQAYPPGAVVVLPGNTHHFHWAKSGEYVTQITAIGPLDLEYLNQKDDPRVGPMDT
jgi:quercetin dioxygenase-like cupin family protein